MSGLPSYQCKHIFVKKYAAQLVVAIEKLSCKNINTTRTQYFSPDYNMLIYFGILMPAEDYRAVTVEELSRCQGKERTVYVLLSWNGRG